MYLHLAPLVVVVGGSLPFGDSSRFLLLILLAPFLPPF